MSVMLRTWGDLAVLASSNLSALSDDELHTVYCRIAGDPFNSPMDKASSGAYTKSQNEAIDKLYWAITAEQDKRYRDRYEGDCREMFHKYFEGKTWEQIKSNPELSEMWGEYSDFHKGVFGYRPHGIVCGVYINPHQYQ